MSNPTNLLILLGYLSSFVSCSNSSQTDPQSLFKMIPGNRTVGLSTTTIRGRTLFECFFYCNLDPNCSAINLQKYEYDGGLFDKIRCDLIDIQNGSGYAVVQDLHSNTFVKTSLIFSSVSKHFSNATYPSFDVRETVSVPEGWGEEYCFLHCSQLDSYCQGFQIEKSCTTNNVTSCQILGASLPTTMPLQADCSWDIHLKEFGEYHIIGSIGYVD